MISTTDWMAMSEAYRGNTQPAAEQRTARVSQGVTDALRNAYRSLPADLPDEFRRLLARLR